MTCQRVICSALGTGCCSRRLSSVTEDTYVCEMIFNYCFQEECGVCPLANISGRKMKVEQARQAICKAKELAEEAGCGNLHIQLIGGDAFVAFEELQEIGTWIFHLQWGVKISVGLTICGDHLSHEVKKWILCNKAKLHITFRWNGARGRSQWENIKFLQHPVIDTVSWCLTKHTIHMMRDEIPMILASGKEVQIDYLDSDTWNQNTINDYTRQLIQISVPYVLQYKRKILLFEESACIAESYRKIHTVDTDGRMYYCRYYSPERAVFSTLREWNCDDSQQSTPCRRMKQMSSSQKILASVHSTVGRLIDEEWVKYAGDCQLV